MEDRRSLILRAIIESFIATAEPVGSSQLLGHYHLGVSSATIRNDMAWLEREGLLTQPHTSAGRVPTDEGFRLFVDELFETEQDFRVPAKVVQQLRSLRQILTENVQQEIEEKLYYAVSVLARVCGTIGFATLPWRETAYYLGVANVLKSPEFHNDTIRASTVIEVLEDKENFLGFLGQLNIGADIAVYIGKENIIREMESCTLIATRYKASEQYNGIIGLLGPKRMDYRLNIATLNAVRNDL